VWFNRNCCHAVAKLQQKSYRLCWSHCVARPCNELCFLEFLRRGGTKKKIARTQRVPLAACAETKKLHERQRMQKKHVELKVLGARRRSMKRRLRLDTSSASKSRIQPYNFRNSLSCSAQRSGHPSCCKKKADTRRHLFYHGFNHEDAVYVRQTHECNTWKNLAVSFGGTVVLLQPNSWLCYYTHFIPAQWETGT